MSRCWLVLSGKGGTGKSTFTASLALLLAQKGYQTCCVDMDLGMRSLDMLMNLQDEVVWNVMDVLRGNCSLSDAVLSHHRFPGAALLPASQLMPEGALDESEFGRLIEQLKKRYAYVLLDAPAGTGAMLPALIRAADASILVAAPDEIAIRDAERIVSLAGSEKKAVPLLVLNRVQPRLVKSGVQMSPEAAALFLDAPLLGYVPEDSQVAVALHNHRTPAEGKGKAFEALRRICARFTGEKVPLPKL